MTDSLSFPERKRERERGDIHSVPETGEREGTKDKNFVSPPRCTRLATVVPWGSVTS